MINSTTYKNNWLNFTHIEHWLNHEGDTEPGTTVSDYMTEIYRNLQYNSSQDYLQPFDCYVVETWNVNRSDCPQDIKSCGGLTWTNKHTIINSTQVGEKVYSHEFGHNYGFSCGLFNDQMPTKIGYNLYVVYKNLREDQLTDKSKLNELFAEDFSYLFGTKQIKNNPDEYWYGKELGATIMPDKSPGLYVFIKSVCPLFHHLNGKDFDQFSYDKDKKVFTWRLINKWWFYTWYKTETFDGYNFG